MQGYVRTLAYVHTIVAAMPVAEALVLFPRGGRCGKRNRSRRRKRRGRRRMYLQLL
jgi:hypothetical protein